MELNKLTAHKLVELLDSGSIKQTDISIVEIRIADDVINEHIRKRHKIDGEIKELIENNKNAGGGA